PEGPPSTWCVFELSSHSIRTKTPAFVYLNLFSPLKSKAQLTHMKMPCPFRSRHMAGLAGAELIVVFSKS
ncbi:MAG TPA: hypothetical protein VMN36_11905, partial [Verrucomicrobiales bacterium]|nr:hypothetical protein [Verrucomicrobiales bacterium]